MDVHALGVSLKKLLGGSERNSEVGFEDRKLKPQKVFLVFGVSCLIIGLAFAYIVAREPFGYVASMTWSFLSMFLICPGAVGLLVAAVIAGFRKNTTYAGSFLVSCFLLPFCFFGSVKLFEATGIAEYSKPGRNEMRPIDEEPNGNVIVVYTKESTFEEQQKLSNEVIHPWKEGPGFTGETGVQASIGLLDIDGRNAQKIFFRASATEAEKERLRMGLQASPIVCRYFENLTEVEVRAKLESEPRKTKL